MNPMSLYKQGEQHRSLIAERLTFERIQAGLAYASRSYFIAKIRKIASVSRMLALCHADV